MTNHFLFSLAFIKKNNQTNFLYKKPKPNQNWFKPTSFGFVFWTKTGLARFFWFEFGSVLFFSISGL